MTEDRDHPGFEYVSGGTLAPDAPSYVERQADLELFSSLKSGETCYVLNSRQMGKSSLCVRTIQKLRDAGVRTIFCDLTKFGGRNLTAEQWYAALVSEMGRELGLRDEFIAHWKENSGLPPVQRLFGALVEEGLKAESALVVFIDEIDVTLSLPFSADEFFAAIRQCYVGRATDERLKQLSFCLLGTATPADLIQDTRVSPFNIGKRIELRDFISPEAETLAAGLGDRKLLDRVLYWTGGHPYLTQRLCQAVSKSEVKDVDRVCSDLFLTHAAKESDDNLAFVRNRLLKSEADLASLLDLYRQLRQGKRVPDDETNPLCAILKLSGVAKVENGSLNVRNRIYEHVFDRDWVETHLPDAEKRRQKEAYRKGLFRAFTLGGTVAVVLGLVSLSSIRNAQDAREAETRAKSENTRAERLLYFTSMQLAQKELENNNFGRVQELLQQTSKSPLRGFEWYYLQRACRPESQVLHDDRRGVSVVTYSPDGKLLASGGKEGVVRIWDTATGKLIKRLEGHTDWVASVAFSPDGRFIASASDDKTNRVWDLQSGETTYQFGSRAASITFAPDSKTVATGCYDNTVRTWDLVGRRQVKTFAGHQGVVWSVVFSRDGRRLASGSLDGTARYWDSSSGKSIQTYVGHLGEVWFVALSPDGKMLATGSSDKTAWLWNLSTGKPLRKLAGHADTAGAVAFSPDGRLLATGSWDNTAKLWDVRSGKELATFRGHADDVNSLAFSPSEPKLATSSYDKTVRIFNLPRLEASATLKESIGIRWVAVSSEGEHLAVSYRDGKARIWSARTGVTFELLGHLLKVDTIIFSKDDKRVVTGSADGTARIWDVDSGRQLAVLKVEGKGVTGAIFSPDGSNVATTCWDGTVKVWSTITGTRVQILKGHTLPAFWLAYSPDGKTLASVSGDLSARLWDLETGRCLHVLKGHKDDVTAIAFSPDGRFLATGGSDNIAKVWDVQTGSFKFDLVGHSGAVWWIAFSPDGSRIITTSSDNTIKMWDAQSGLEAISLTSRGGGACAISRDGRRLSTCEAVDGGVKIKAWEAATADQVSMWERQESEGSK